MSTANQEHFHVSQRVMARDLAYCDRLPSLEPKSDPSPHFSHLSALQTPPSLIAHAMDSTKKVTVEEVLHFTVNDLDGAM